MGGLSWYAALRSDEDSTNLDARAGGSSRYAALRSDDFADEEPVGPSRYAALNPGYQPAADGSAGQRYAPTEPGYRPGPEPGGARYPQPDLGAEPDPQYSPSAGYPVASPYATPGGGHHGQSTYPARSGYPAGYDTAGRDFPVVPGASGYQAEPGYPTEPDHRPDQPTTRGYRAVAAVDGQWLAPAESYRPATIEQRPPVAMESRVAETTGHLTTSEDHHRPGTPDQGYPRRLAEPAGWAGADGDQGSWFADARPAAAAVAFEPAGRAVVSLDQNQPSHGSRQADDPDPETERAIEILRRDLGLPRIFAFANPKGGVHKTTATVLAAATIGSVRGRGVLAWDDNELRGTLGLRAGSARHARTIRHLIANLAEVEARNGSDLLNRLDDFLRHASDGSYDVLAGEENSRFAARLDQHTVGRVLELLRRTHDVICVDTGNNVESPNWQTVLRAADQLVVTTVPREDAAFAADWMLDLLHEEGMGTLVENAVTLISCPTAERSPLLGDLQRHFATRTRAVAVVPYDPALETGSSIEYHLLQPETRNAWRRAAAVMVEPFTR